MTRLLPSRATTLAVAIALALPSLVVLHAQSRIAVYVAGLRVVGPGIGENGGEQRPYNEKTGTSIVLVLKVPKGVGLVELDEDTSTIDAATDDKGTDLRVDASFGPFPEIVKDGSAGLMEIRLGVRPAAGSTAINAEGSLAVTSATGSKPVKTAAVPLVEGKTVKVGTITLTVGKVEAGDEDTSVTFNLPRTSLKTIKSLKFVDAKGTEIESDRVGSGYMNDVGELDYKIKTKAKSVSIVCDMWQGLKAEKVPFKLSAGLGF
jgi:hypothetical protein